ncbi:DJ-1/PfpI family protein [Streptomyces sp. NPDC000609]|uniref:DJ-1/PfpI family protein n=1 Tax=Streptomyces sp. NPDC000609 TaxID=3160957 RepID=UPI0033923D24
MVTNYGVEQDELLVPQEHLSGWGAEVAVAAVSMDEVRTLAGDREPGKKLTSCPSLKTDIRNAGGEWTDEPVVTDDRRGRPLITSRNPGDLEPFLREVDAALTVDTR